MTGLTEFLSKITGRPKEDIRLLLQEIAKTTLELEKELDEEQLIKLYENLSKLLPTEEEPEVTVQLVPAHPTPLPDHPTGQPPEPGPPATSYRTTWATDQTRSLILTTKPLPDHPTIATGTPFPLDAKPTPYPTLHVKTTRPLPRQNTDALQWAQTLEENPYHPDLLTKYNPLVLEQETSQYTLKELPAHAPNKHDLKYHRDFL